MSNENKNEEWEMLILVGDNPPVISEGYHTFYVKKEVEEKCECWECSQGLPCLFDDFF